MNSFVNDISRTNADIRNEQPYSTIAQNETDRTSDNFEEQNEILERRRADLLKTNLYRTRVIETEINSSLIMQIVLYFNFFYSCLCFPIQLFSITYKVDKYFFNTILALDF